MLAFLHANVAGTSSSKFIGLNVSSINTSGPEFSSDELGSAALSCVVSKAPKDFIYLSRLERTPEKVSISKGLWINEPLIKRNAVQLGWQGQH